MNNSSKRVSELFQKYWSGSATEAETREFLDYVDDPVYQSQIQELLSVAFDNQTELTDLSESARAHLLSLFFEDEQIPKIRSISRHRIWLRVAAAVVLISGAGIFFYLSNHQTKVQPASAFVNDVAPGKKGATLTLADGRKITLSDAADGELAKEAGVVITKSAAGRLVYDVRNTAPGTDKVNTLSTARGETYEVRLPDGSVVVLNAASSLTYSPSFNKEGERKVELTGEAYFEVAKDKKHPFVVRTASEEIKVLGTHFNVNSYSDEVAVKTTLLEGSVNVSTADDQKILNPGEQSVVIQNKVSVIKTDVESVVAWKNGEFMFTGLSITEIMRVLARWYNVDVEYRGPVTTEQFEGSTPKERNISEVLELLELTKAVHFKIEGRKIIVTK